MFNKPIHFTLDKMFMEFAGGTSLFDFYKDKLKNRTICGWEIKTDLTTSDNREVTCKICKRLLKDHNYLIELNIQITKFNDLVNKMKKEKLNVQ